MMEELLGFLQGSVRVIICLHSQFIFIYGTEHFFIRFSILPFRLRPCVPGGLFKSFEFVTNITSISQKCHIIYFKLNANVDLLVVNRREGILDYLRKKNIFTVR